MANLYREPERHDGAAEDAGPVRGAAGDREGRGAARGRVGGTVASRCGSPAGETAWIQRGGRARPGRRRSARDGIPAPTSLVAAARKFMGAPYLWGGMSAAGRGLLRAHEPRLPP